MGSGFMGIQIALRGLQAAQLAQETTGHNITNANTPGFSRQEVMLQASQPYGVPVLGGGIEHGQIGTGVQVTAIRRYRDAFIDLQIRDESQFLGMWNSIKDTLHQIELIIPEPSDTGLNKLLGRFWNSWEDLANEPQSQARRVAVSQETANLCSTINHTYDQLATLQQEQDRQLEIKVQQVNEAADQLAALNKEIQKVVLVGNQANDLRDRRDLLLDQLSQLTNITYTEDDNGVCSVYVGGTALVSGLNTNHLVASDTDSDGLLDISWRETGYPLVIRGGEIKGILTARDEIIGNEIDKLNTLALELRDAVNEIHRTGYGLNNSTGLDFLTGTSAKDLALSSAILASTDNIATAQNADSPGNGDIATAISELRNSARASLGGRTINDYYQAVIIQQLGTNTKGADDTCANRQALVDHLTQQRESLSGVSLDEEAANLIRYQRAYQAAARVMTTVDEMLDQLINQTGRVGR